MTIEAPAPQTVAIRPLRTVLVGTSLEDESDQVVRTGAAVARAAGARVVLVHASPGTPHFAGPEIGLGGDFSAELAAWCQENLSKQIERLGLDPAEIAGAEVVAGEPHRVLIEAAQKTCADLIVVGATGSGPFAAELLGSTADRVLRKATCPVLLVRGELPIPPRRVLAPVDLSPLAGDAYRSGLRLLGQIARGQEVEVRAANVVSFFDVLAVKRQTAGEFSPEEAERVRGEELDRFLRENGAGTEFDVKSALISGEARFEILRELHEHPVDLVLLGTHGRGGLDRLMLGSVASTVARKAPCSVLLVSPDAAFAECIGEAVVERTTPAWHAEPATADRA